MIKKRPSLLLHLSAGMWHSNPRFERNMRLTTRTFWASAQILFYLLQLTNLSRSCCLICGANSCEMWCIRISHGGQLHRGLTLQNLHDGREHFYDCWPVKIGRWACTKMLYSVTGIVCVAFCYVCTDPQAPIWAYSQNLVILEHV